MKILVVKMTSLGDCVHALPAIDDLKHAYPECHIDWAIEAQFQDVARLSQHIDTIIPIYRKRWRKRRLHWQTYREKRTLKQRIRLANYDAVIDVQGLHKSARVSRYSHGVKWGYAKHVIKDKRAYKAYDKTIPVTVPQHAIERIRDAFAYAFNYQQPNELNYGLIESLVTPSALTRPKAIVLLHSTTWVSKHWHDSAWIKLAQLLEASGFHCVIPWVDDTDKQRAQRIKAATKQTIILDNMPLFELAHVMRTCQGAVGVDTGLTHVAAGLGLPTVTIFGASDSLLTGAMGSQVINLQSTLNCSPCLSKQCQQLNKVNLPACYDRITPEMVIAQLQTICS